MITKRAHKQAALNIKYLYLKHLRVFEFQIKGTEVFTLFEKLNIEQQTEIIERINFNTHEIPVLLLTVKAGIYIVNTSERFIKITSKTIESIYYKEFEAMIFYQSIDNEIKKLPPIKLVDIGLKKKDGDMTFLKIPAGKFLHFWDVVRQLNMISIAEE